MVWSGYLFQNFLEFIVIHTVKGFGIVNKAEIDVFLELSCFFHDPAEKAMATHSSVLAWAKKQGSSRETSTSALLTMPKPLTVWITTNCEKFLK